MKFKEHDDWLTEKLRNEDSEPVEVPDNLRCAILARVAEERNKQNVFPITFRVGWQASAMAAVVIFGTLLTFVLRMDHSQEDQPERKVNEHIIEQPRAPITLESPIESHPLIHLSSLIESPLQTEQQHLLNDAGSALKFLSKSFLPSKALRDQITRKVLGAKAGDSFEEDA